MIVSAIGVSLVVHAIAPEGPLGRRASSRVDVLETVAQRATEATKGTGEAGLVRWFRQRGMERPVPPMVLLNQRGEVIAGWNLPPGERRRLASGTAMPGNAAEIRQTEFTHDGEIYRIVSHAPRQRSLGRTLILIAFRPPFFWLLLLIAIPLSVIVSFGVARYLVRPLHSIEQAGRRLSEGDLSARVGSSLGNRGDEIAEFANAFDQMAERIESLVRTHKVLLRDVSHELRSPLARAHAALSLARQSTHGMIDSELDRLELEIDRLNAMIGKLLTFSRLDSGERPMLCEPVELVGLLTEIAGDSRFEASADSKSVRLHGEDVLTVNGDPELLASCFENVVRNAVRHTHADTAVDIALTVDRESGQGVRVDVRDHGDGVPEEQLTHIFEPFHRIESDSGADHERSGIGLAIAQQAVKLHHGRILARNAADGGLIMSVFLPFDAPARG